MEKGKKAINVLIAFFISHKSDIKTFLKWILNQCRTALVNMTQKTITKQSLSLLLFLDSVEVFFFSLLNQTQTQWIWVKPNYSCNKFTIHSLTDRLSGSSVVQSINWIPNSTQPFVSLFLVGQWGYSFVDPRNWFSMHLVMTG